MTSARAPRAIAWLATLALAGAPSLTSAQARPRRSAPTPPPDAPASATPAAASAPGTSVDTSVRDATPDGAATEDAAADDEARPAAPPRPRGNPLIERGVAEYDALHFEEALQTLSAALMRPSNTPADLARIYRQLALTYLALDHPEEAEGAYRLMLQVMPEAQVTYDMSPRFREFFGDVQRRWEDEGRPGMLPPAPVVVRHRSPTEAQRETPFVLEITLDDPETRAAEVIASYRRSGDTVFAQAPAELGDDGAYRATVSATALIPPFLEYYFEVLDPTGAAIASRGDPSAPLRVPVPAPEDGNVDPLVFVVAGIGTALIAAAVITGVVLGSSGAPQSTLVVTIGD